jgi:uncharacterized protein YbjT (DUF2867 family)
VILIVGGSGTLGRLAAKRLLACGLDVRIMTRNPQRAAGLRDAGADVVRGDLLDQASLSRACAGVEQVVAAAHSMAGRGRDASSHVDDAGHRRLIDVAMRSGVRHMVYTSVYDYGDAYRAVPFFRIKFEIERHLRASGLRYTILRPTAFMDFHAHVLIGVPVLTKRKVMLIGRGEQPRNFVAAADVAQVIERAVVDSALAKRTIDIAGPENLTHMQVVRTYERLSGARAKVAHLPLTVARAMAVVVKPVHAGLSQILQAAVLAETTDQAVDSAALRAELSLVPTDLQTWIEQNVV